MAKKKHKKDNPNNVNLLNNQVLDKLRSLHPEADFQVELNADAKSILVEVSDRHTHRYRICGGKVTSATVNDVPKDIAPGWPF